MKILVSLSLMFTSFVANSQVVDTAYLHFIHGQLRELQPDGIVYYSDKVAKRQIDPIIKFARSQLTHLEKRGLVFTPSEKKHLVESLKKISISRQNDSLFADSRRLSIDTLVPFVERNFRRRLDSLQHSPDSLIARKNYFKLRPWAFCFSDPIYLRNRTILIYYFMYYLNSSGEESIWVCRKKNGRWDKVGSLGGGAW